MRTYYTALHSFLYITILLVFATFSLNGQFSPVISDIEDQEINEGSTFEAIHLDDFVEDSDHTDQELSWSVENADELTVAIQDHVATVIISDENWFGSETVTFTVIDPDSNSSSDDATFSVLPVNDAPIVGDITGQSILEGASFEPINLDLFVSDIDNNVTDLTWTASPNPNVNVGIDASHVATLETDAGWTGSETINFIVQDPAGASDSDDADFTVTAIEALPEAQNDRFEVDEGGTYSTPAPGVLSNDSDADGDALSAVLISNPQHTSGFTLGGDGSILYEHDGLPVTSDVFTYAASDQKGQSLEATVTITINPINDDPVIGDIPDQSITEGQEFEPIDLDNFVSDEEDANNLLAWEATGNTNLLVDIHPDTHVAIIEPVNNTWSGEETIIFTVKDTDTDQGTASDNAKFSLAAVAEAPVAVDDLFNVVEGETLNEGAPGVLWNDSDGDGDDLFAEIVTLPSFSTAFSLNANGSFTYTHNGDETGDDSFSYHVLANGDVSNTVTVTINVTPKNDPPVAVNDAYTVAEGGTLNQTAPGVLANDTDPELQTLTALKISDPANGTLTLNANGSFIYVHNGSETTTDAFTYRASDGTDNSNTATVTITITPVNDPPVAVNDAYTIAEGGTLNQTAPGVLTNDTDPESQPLTAQKITDPVNGSLTLNANGSFTYVHNGSETTSDVFTYRANDGIGNSNVATVTITITGQNDPPVALNDAYTVAEGGTLNQSVPGVLANDTDPELQTLTALKISDPANGTLTLNANGSFIYVHNGSETTTDAFTYRASDGTGNSNVATVSFTVTPTNDPPVATNVIITADNNYVGTLHTGNFDFSDPEGDQQGTHTYQWYRSDNSGGTSPTSIPDANTITYIPVATDLGKWISFEVTPKDEHGLAGIAVKSPFRQIGEFTASISGTNTFCSGAIMPITLTITGGSAPYTAVLKRTGTQDTTIYNIESSPWTINVKIAGTYTLQELTDANDNANVSANPVVLGIKYSPIARISGSTSICPGETTSIQVTLEGNPQSDYTCGFTYLKNGSNPVTVSGILGKSHTLIVDPGLYTLSNVSDASGEGCVSGSAEIIARTSPTATISGSNTICEHTSTPLNVNLTGNAPWKFYYKRNSETPILVENVESSPLAVSISKAGTYTLYEVSDGNACIGSVSGSALINVTPAPNVTISGLEPPLAYDIASTQIYTVTGTPAGGIFSDPPIISNSLFIPRLLTEGTYNIIYTYRASPSSCYGYDTLQVNILEADAVINFENNRTQYCKNDAPFTITGVNLKGVTGTFSIISGTGIIHNTGTNTAVIKPSELNVNKYTVRYTYRVEGTDLHVESDFEIGAAPEAKFDWETVCFHAGEAINFTNTSVSNFGYFTDTSYLWRVAVNAGSDYFTTRDISYTFNEPGVRRMELRIENSYGCLDTAIYNFNLRPTIALDEMYYESFAGKPLSWQSAKDPTSNINSWKLATPSKHGSPLRGFSGAYSDSMCWYTKILTSPAPTEKSWVSSPCFDFTEMDKPMLTMRIWRLFNSNRDGANIMASADSGKTWTLIGELGDGENWYNSYDIMGTPGGTGMGWANNTGLSNDNGWVRARHALDFLKGESEVQFRINYGSAQSAQSNDGIAFDDFTINERSKMALVEHFTNTMTQKSYSADSALDALAKEFSANIIDLQYHTSSPAGDPFYNDNPLFPTSRQFYYGISAVPYAVLDGGTKSTHRFTYDNKNKLIDKNPIIVQSLEETKFNVTMNSSIENSTLFTTVQVSAQQVIPMTEISVRIAIVERVIESITSSLGDTVFRNVVKAMLPSAAGNTIYRSWAIAEGITIDESWELENVYDRRELRVVAFVQNESTQLVYQAAMDTISMYTPIDQPIELSKNTEYIVYPNPAWQVATVKFGFETNEDITLELFNNIGRLVQSVFVTSGSRYADIPVDELPEGLYLLRVRTAKDILGISKIMVTK